MLTPARFWRRLRALLRGRRLTTELDEEMQFHLEMETARRVDAGEDPLAARHAAMRDFGGVTQHREDAVDARGVRPIQDLLTDLRVGIRSLRRQRTYTAVAVLTLALGIGGTTALGSAVYRVLLAPYPFPEAERIVTLWESDTRVPGSTRQVSSGNFFEWERRTSSLDLIAAAEPYSFDWIGPDGPEQFESTLVTEDFFAIQGLRPLLGRVFTAEEFEAGRDGVVLLTEKVWRTRFGSDTSMVGRAMVLDTLPRIVVGVMPDDAMAPFAAEMWAPKAVRADEPLQRVGGYWQVIARLSAGTTLAQARADLDGVARQLAGEFPATNASTGIAIVSLRDAVSGSARRSLLVLFGAVAFVMFIACVNVANLQLGEAVRRRRELAIRTAIGAGRGRLVRQLLAESLLVATIGTLAGLAVAYAGIGAIRSSAPSGLWQLERLSLDAPALLFASMLTLVVTVAIGVMPVLAAARIQLAPSLAAGVRSSAGSGMRRRANRLLAISEVALALVLLVGAGLLFRSLSELGRTDRGFVTDDVLVTTVQTWSYYQTAAARTEYARQALARVQALPGVSEAGVTSSLPLSWPIGFERTGVRVEGIEPSPGEAPPAVRVAAISAAYLRTLGIPVLKGRAFSEEDRNGSTPVALVNRAFARRHFGDADPVGRRITLGFMSAPVAREIVGVIGDVRHDGLHADPPPGVFVPHAQGPTGALHIVVRASVDVAALQPAVRAALLALNGAMPLEMTTMEALLATSLEERRFQLGLLGAFAATALLLAAIGIYGVMSRATSERTHEIGVRLAVGAQPHEVRRMVLRSGGAIAAIGVACGTAAALVLTRYMEAMLFGVTALDPLTFTLAAVVLIGAALLASWLPAWRASAVDPVVALRNE